MRRRKINVRIRVAVAWLGKTARIAALTAKRSKLTPRLPANAGTRNVQARLIKESDHGNLRRKNTPAACVRVPLAELWDESFTLVLVLASFPPCTAKDFPKGVDLRRLF